VDTTFALPQGGGNFTGFGGFDLASTSGRLNLAFVGIGTGGQQGVYDEDVPICPPYVQVHPPVPGPIWTVADTNSAIPQGTGNFTGFAGVACGGPCGISIAFVGLGANGQQGIYAAVASAPSSTVHFRLVKVIDLNDTLDGKALADLQLAAGGLQGFTLAYKAVFADGTQGTYTLPLIANAVITSTSFSGDDAHLTFTAPAGHNFWLLGGQDLNAWDSNSIVNVPGTGGSVDFYARNQRSKFPNRFFWTVKRSDDSPDLPPINPGPE
jgi:hypothetical protein